MMGMIKSDGLKEKRRRDERSKVLEFWMWKRQEWKAKNGLVAVIKKAGDDHEWQEQWSGTGGSLKKGVEWWIKETHTHISFIVEDMNDEEDDENEKEKSQMPPESQDVWSGCWRSAAGR